MADSKEPKGTHSFEGTSERHQDDIDQASPKHQKQEENSWQNSGLSNNRPHIPARSTGLCAIASLFLVIVCLLLVHFEINRVGSLRISEGNYVTQEQIASIVGDPKGKYLPSLHTESMKKKIQELSPMVADVEFDLSLTRRLTVRIIDENYVYSYRAENGEILLLNENFKVLGTHPKSSCKKKNCAYEKGALTELYIPSPEEIKVGEILEFPGKESLVDFVEELSQKKGELYSKLNLLDVRNTRHIVFIFDSLVCVELSEASDLDIKCTALEKMMDKRKTRQEEINTRFTYVDPISGSIYWAVEEWANLYEDYPNSDRP